MARPLDVYRTSPEVAAAQPAIAVLGVGAIEQHGRHLPVATDWSYITELTRQVADHLGALWLPAIPFSMSECHGALAGTVWLRPETLAKVIRDLVRSLLDQGITRIVIMNGHGGNFILEPVLQELNLSHPELIVIMPATEAPEPSIFATTGEIHAGEVETSTQLALNPELVKAAPDDAVPAVGREFLDYVFMADVSPGGVWGRPSLASAEKGWRAAAWQVESAVRSIQRTFAAVERLKAGPGPRESTDA